MVNFTSVEVEFPISDHDEQGHISFAYHETHTHLITQHFLDVEI